MSEHLLFLQAAGSDFSTAHELVNAVKDVLHASHVEQSVDNVRPVNQQNLGAKREPSGRRAALDTERLAERFERAGFKNSESLLLALGVLGTTASPLADPDVNWIASVATRVGNADLLLETAGVIFAFNTINRIADARRVRLEYRFLRELKPLRGWLERRLASLTGLAYDLSFKHRSGRKSAEMMYRLGVLLERLGIPDVPDIFHWLGGSPVVLEGVLEMLDVNVTHATVRPALLKEAMAIGVVSKAMPGSNLRGTFDYWLPQEALLDAKALRAWAAPSGRTADHGLAAACRRYAWQVANAAYTITDEQILQLRTLGLSEVELLDLTLATAVFSALAIIEPIGVAVAPVPIAASTSTSSTPNHEVQVQMA